MLMITNDTSEVLYATVHLTNGNSYNINIPVGGSFNVPEGVINVTFINQSQS